MPCALCDTFSCRFSLLVKGIGPGTKILQRQLQVASFEEGKSFPAVNIFPYDHAQSTIQKQQLYQRQMVGVEAPWNFNASREGLADEAGPARQRGISHPYR